MRTEILVVPLLSCGIIAFHLLIVNAYTTTLNPFTGKLDYVGVNAGAQGINTCGDSTHALGFTSTGTFACQNVTGSGGTSTLAISSGAPTNSVIISSPTSNVVFDSNTFVGSLQGTTSAFITINPSTTAFHLTQAVVVSSYTGTWATTSTSFVPVSSSAVTITPTSNNSCIKFEASIQEQNHVANTNCYVTLFQGSTNLGIGGSGDFGELFVGSGGPLIYTQFSIVGSTCPKTMSPITFTVEQKTDSGGSCQVGGTGTVGSTLLENYQ